MTTINLKSGDILKVTVDPTLPAFVCQDDDCDEFCECWDDDYDGDDDEDWLDDFFDDDDDDEEDWYCGDDDEEEDEVDDFIDDTEDLIDTIESYTSFWRDSVQSLQKLATPEQLARAEALIKKLDTLKLPAMGGGEAGLCC